MQPEEKNQKKIDVQPTTQKKKQKRINPLHDRTRLIPFVVPNEVQQKWALGSMAGQKWRLKRSIQRIYNDFGPIKTPEPGDNLWEREEDGQDFHHFEAMVRNHLNVDEETIYIVPFKCNLEKTSLQCIKKRARRFFHGVRVRIYHFNEDIDMSQFDEMVSENGQKYYDGAKLNMYFSKRLPKKTYSIAIVTSLLIYNGENPSQELKNKWVIGLGSIKDRSSLTSFEEIVKKGYGIVRDYEGTQEDESQQNIDFLSKVINHELCHTFGMRHCVYFTCIMNGTASYLETTKKVPYLCPICLRKLQNAIGFDIAERYEAAGDKQSLDLAVKIRSVVK